MASGPRSALERVVWRPLAPDDLGYVAAEVSERCMGDLKSVKRRLVKLIANLP